MSRIIVTTTINEPTKALLKYASLPDWKLLIVGDLKTPHDLYTGKPEWIYMHPKEQEHKYPELSKCLGWNNVQRRNIGFIEAYHMGAELIATVDDDNVPLENWGQNCYVGQKVN